MNKLLISTVIACGLLLLDAPEATAHEQRDNQYGSPRYDYSDSYRRGSYRRDAHSRDGYRRNYYGSKYNREKRMPRWLKHNRSFRHWFEHSRLKKNRRLSWYQLFDIYLWEHSNRRYRRH